jgi:opacity protein-like surface antigen
MRTASSGRVSLACAAIFVSSRVLADNPVGVYVGADVGESHVRTTREIVDDTDYEYQFNARHAAWKVSAGIRPLSLVGAELEYTDFGNPDSRSAIGGFGGLSRSDARALSLFGLAYLPLPVPFLDVYGKLGVARLRTTARVVSASLYCLGGDAPCVATSFDVTDWSTDLAYGAGVQGKIGPLGIHLEYERIALSGGNPDVLSVGATWTF